MFNSSLAPSVVKTELDVVFNQEFDVEEQKGYADATDAGVFNQKTTDRSAVITEQFQGTGYFEARNEEQELAQATARVGNQKTFSVVNYAKEIDISKNLFDDDQHDTISMMVSSMGRNARLTRDKNAFNTYNLGFTTVTTNDGVALFSDSHVTLSGDTVDNKLTAALSESSLDTAIQALIEQKTQDGTSGGHQPAVLLVPNRLFKLATEITQSELRSGVDYNDLNYYSKIYPDLMVKTSRFLGAAYGGSDTAWFLLSKNHSINRWVRQALTTDMVDYKFQRNNNYIYKAEYRETTGPISFEGVVGSTGTA